MSLPTRDSLEAMKRVDLQRLCKDYGVKANLKTEALIDLLLDASQPASRRPAQQHPVSTRRSDSRALPSQRPRGRSTESIIIHDTDDEGQELGAHTCLEGSAHGGTQRGYESEPILDAPIRTRKAKESQTKLGLGKPVIAGGSGARVVTKSGSAPKRRRGKDSRTFAIDTISEEEPDPIPETVSGDHAIAAKAESDPSVTSVILERTTVPATSLASLEHVDKHVADALRPLHDQMQSLKAEFERLKIQVADSESLKSTVDNLTTEVKGLKEKAAHAEAEVQFLRQCLSDSSATPISPGPSTRGFETISARTSRRASANNAKSTDRVQSQTRATSIAIPQTAEASGTHSHVIPHPSSPLHPHPGIAPTTLGKRNRDSIASSITEVAEQVDELEDDELESPIVKHTTKRQKVGLRGSDSDGEVVQERRMVEEEEEGSLPPTPRVPSFMVFNDPPPTHSTTSNSSYIDPPPPQEHLPEFYPPPSVPPSHRLVSSTADAAENQPQTQSDDSNPFQFAFAPLPGTPMYPLTMSSFPFPESPASPTPVGRAVGTSRDPFGFGVLGGGPRSRVGGRLLSGSGGGFIDPAALTRPTDKDGEHRVTSHEVATGLGLTAVRTSATDPGGPNAPPMVKKTMYGTELDGDSRFGDFGVEGVASGFWAGGRF